METYLISFLEFYRNVIILIVIINCKLTYMIYIYNKEYPLNIPIIFNIVY